MKIAIDIQSVMPKSTGIGYYTKNLIGEYHNTKEMEFLYCKYDGRGDLGTLSRIYWENVLLNKQCAQKKADILHVPGFAGPYYKGRFKKVTTVHDLIGMVYPGNLAPLSRFYWQKWLPACVKASDFIIADSESTKKDIISLLGFPSDRIDVIYLAADKNFMFIEDKEACFKALKKKTGIEGSFILSVSTIEPRKNFEGIIKAYSHCRNMLKDYKLVIVGKKSWGYPAVEKLTRELGIEDRILFLDYVETETLTLLYNCAELFIFASFYEGFGLPVLEAFSCGTPVITSNSSSLPEVAKEAALQFNTDDLASLCGQIKNAIGSKDLLKELSLKGLERARAFTWENTASKTIGVYRKVL